MRLQVEWDKNEENISLARGVPDNIYAAFEGQVAWADMIIPTITPNKPSALPKISITRIFTNREEFWASERAQLLPIIPTHSLWRMQCRQSMLWRMKEGKRFIRDIPANKVREANNNPRGKDWISCSKGLWCIYLWCRYTLQLGLQNDCHNNTIDSNSFTENDTENKAGIRAYSE